MSEQTHLRRVSRRALLVSLASMAICIALFLRQYGFLRYSVERAELLRLLKPTAEPASWTCEEPWPDICGILASTVRVRQMWLARPDANSQIRALRLSRDALSLAFEPSVALINLEELLKYLATDGDAAWRAMVETSLEEDCRPELISLVDGYRGAVCVAILKGFVTAVEQPEVSLVDAVEDNCSTAFPGARHVCHEAASRYPDLLIAASTRRAHLELVERAERNLSAQREKS